MTDETAATNAAGDAIAPEPQVAESAPAGNEPAAAPEKDGFSKRIDELTKNWRDQERRTAEAERDREYWREQALRNQTPREPPKHAAQPEAVKTLADFEYDDAKYQEYLFDRAEARAVAAAERRLREQQETDTKERRREKFSQRIAEFSKETKDFHEKVFTPRNPVSDAMRDVFEESDEGPALAYYLANNLSEAAEIYRLPPLAAARELGRIEAKLLSAREQAAKKVSEAPPPVPKVDGVNPGTPSAKPDEADSDKLSDEEWARRRNKQLAKQQRGS